MQLLFCLLFIFNFFYQQIFFCESIAMDGSKENYASKIQNSNRNILQIQSFQVGDVIDYRALGIEVGGQYSANRQNRVKIPGLKRTISKPVVLKVSSLRESYYGPTVIFDFFDLESNKLNGSLKLSLPNSDTIQEDKDDKAEFCGDEKEIIIDSVGSKDGCGLAALNIILSLFEKNQNLYRDRKYFTLMDINEVKDKKISQHVINLYQKLGFAARAQEISIERNKIINSINELNKKKRVAKQ